VRRTGDLYQREWREGGVTLGFPRSPACTRVPNFLSSRAHPRSSRALASACTRRNGGEMRFWRCREGARVCTPRAWMRRASRQPIGHGLHPTAPADPYTGNQTRPKGATFLCNGDRLMDFFLPGHSRLQNVASCRQLFRAKPVILGATVPKHRGNSVISSLHKETRWFACVIKSGRPADYGPVWYNFMSSFTSSFTTSIAKQPTL
jgi:hypothetical protein